jgi:hypothetical protein
MPADRRTYADVVARGGAGVAEVGARTPQVAVDEEHRRTICLGGMERGALLKSARDQVSAACAEWGLPSPVCQVATLLTSEIVANASQHGHPPRHLVVEVGDGCLVVSCQDCSPGVPSPRDPDVDRPGGRGLLMLQKLAARWGYHDCAADPDDACCRVDPDKQVWFVMLTH